MKVRIGFLSSLVLLSGLTAMSASAGDDSGFADELSALQNEFDVATFSGLRKSDRKHAFEDLVEHAADFSERYPDRVEAVAWNGIILSAYAGEVSALGAMKYAKAAREALHQAEDMAPEALDGGIYASLGALYSKVPGGFVGFGDDDLAAEYFDKAVAIDADNIDTNFFFGEFLLDQEQYDQAFSVLNRALAAPEVTARPLFDTGRRTEIQEMLESTRDHLGRTASN